MPKKRTHPSWIEHGQREKLRAARERELDDLRLLAMRDEEGLTYERIAVRLGGISRPAAHKRVRKARARQALLRKEGLAAKR